MALRLGVLLLVAFAGCRAAAPPRSVASVAAAFSAKERGGATVDLRVLGELAVPAGARMMLRPRWFLCPLLGRRGQRAGAVARVQIIVRAVRRDGGVATWSLRAQRGGAAIALSPRQAAGRAPVLLDGRPIGPIDTGYVRAIEFAVSLLGSRAVSGRRLGATAVMRLPRVGHESLAVRRRVAGAARWTGASVLFGVRLPIREIGDPDWWRSPELVHRLVLTAPISPLDEEVRPSSVVLPRAGQPWGLLGPRGKRIEGACVLVIDLDDARPR